MSAEGAITKIILTTYFKHFHPTAFKFSETKCPGFEDSEFFHEEYNDGQNTTIIPCLPLCSKDSKSEPIGYNYLFARLNTDEGDYLKWDIVGYHQDKRTLFCSVWISCSESYYPETIKKCCRPLVENLMSIKFY